MMDNAADETQSRALWKCRYLKRRSGFTHLPHYMGRDGLHFTISLGFFLSSYFFGTLTDLGYGVLRALEA